MSLDAQLLDATKTSTGRTEGPYGMGWFASSHLGSCFCLHGPNSGYPCICEPADELIGCDHGPLMTRPAGSRAMKSEQDDSSPIAPRGGGLSPPGSFASRRDSWKQPGEPRKIGRIKSFFAKDEIAQVAQAVEEVERTRQEADDALRQQEAKIRQEYAQMMQVDPRSALARCDLFI